MKRELLGKCLTNFSDSCLVVENSQELTCKDREEAGKGDQDGCGFKFTRNLCKHEIKREDLLDYFKEGEILVLAGLVLKRGRKFAAKLVMEKWEIPSDLSSRQ